GSLLIIAFLLLLVVDYLLRKFFYTALRKIAKKTSSEWDDFILHNKVHVQVSRTILVLIAQQVLPLIFIGFPVLTSAVGKILNLCILLTLYGLFNSILKTCRDILRSTKA